jgi:pyridoxamine 5'-phosphate oxidase
MSVSSIRREYVGEPLNEADAGLDPIVLFDRWFAAARATEPDPTAMALATVSADGRPSVRTMLLKGYGADGFVFFTNYNGRKGREIAANPNVALMFFWPATMRQIRIEGAAARVPAAESDEYFASRPLESRLSTYASKQSEAIESRAALDARYQAAAQRFDQGNVPRPEWWGGFRVVPETIEFWQGRVGRMHDRLRYTRQANGTWSRERLAP